MVRFLKTGLQALLIFAALIGLARGSYNVVSPTTNSSIPAWQITGFYPEWENANVIRFYGGCAATGQNAPNIVAQTCINGQRIDTDLSTVGRGGKDTCQQIATAVSNTQQVASNVSTIGTGTGTFSVGSTSNFASSGVLQVDAEYMGYSVTSGTVLNVTSRGLNGTAAVAHNDGSTVFQLIATQSTINALGSAGTGSITATSTAGYLAGQSITLMVGSEFISATVTDATHFNVTARATYGSAGATHLNADYILILDATPAGCTTGAPTIDTFWYPYLIPCDNRTVTTVVWSQTEVASRVVIPSSCDFKTSARQLPFAVPYRQTKAAPSESVGIPVMTNVRANSMGGPSFDWQEMNESGLFTLLSGGSGAGTATGNFASLAVVNVTGGGFSVAPAAQLCPNQIMRGIKIFVRVTAATGAGKVYIRSQGQTDNAGKPVISIGAANQLATWEGWVQGSGGNHQQSNNFQWAATTGLTVDIFGAGCLAGQQ